MTQTPDEALFVNNLTMRILDNQSKGLEPHHGLNLDDIKKAVEFCRKDYTSNQSKSKAAGVSNPSSGPMNLDSLFTTKKSS